MQAKLPDTLIQHRLLEMDLLPRYMKVYSRMRADADLRRGLYTRAVDSQSSEAVYSFDAQREEEQPEDIDDAIQLSLVSALDIEGIAFMVAYLLVLVIQVSLLICSSAILN